MFCSVRIWPVSSSILEWFVPMILENVVALGLLGKISFSELAVADSH